MSRPMWGRVRLPRKKSAPGSPIRVWVTGSARAEMDRDEEERMQEGADGEAPEKQEPSRRRDALLLLIRARDSLIAQMAEEIVTNRDVILGDPSQTGIFGFEFQEIEDRYIGRLNAINSILDNLAMLTALLGQSLPSFWLGLILILIFAEQLNILPSSGYGGPWHVLLPAFTLGAFFTARNTRLVRSGMREVLEQDYIRTARAKGLGERIVVIRHALKNMAIPVVTIVGLDIGQLLGGAVVTETVFAWPGIGRLAIDSILNRDFPVLEADVFFIAVAFVGINLTIDILYTWLDPRVRVR